MPHVTFVEPLHGNWSLMRQYQKFHMRNQKTKDRENINSKNHFEVQKGGTSTLIIFALSMKFATACLKHFSVSHADKQTDTQTQSISFNSIPLCMRAPVIILKVWHHMDTRRLSNDGWGFINTAAWPAHQGLRQAWPACPPGTEASVTCPPGAEASVTCPPGTEASMTCMSTWDWG